MNPRIQAIQARTDRIEELVHLAQHRTRLSTSEQARADALADAETLREFQRDPFPPSFLLRTLAPGAYVVEVGALRCGVDADLWKRGHFYETEAVLVDDARWAAHDAFRAVPGLRGGEHA